MAQSLGKNIRWMYGDASTGAMARANPARWSELMDDEGVIKDLEQLDASHNVRPKLVQIGERRTVYKDLDEIRNEIGRHRDCEEHLCRAGEALKDIPEGKSIKMAWYGTEERAWMQNGADVTE